MPFTFSKSCNDYTALNKSLCHLYMRYVCVQKETFKFTSLLCSAWQRVADAKSIINERERRYIS